MKLRPYPPNDGTERPPPPSRRLQFERGNIEKVLLGLGFKAEDFNKITDEFQEDGV